MFVQRLDPGVGVFQISLNITSIKLKFIVSPVITPCRWSGSTRVELQRGCGMQEANKEMLTIFCTFSPAIPQWGTADAEVKMPSLHNQVRTFKGLL